MSLPIANLVRSILISPACQEINFEIRGIRISAIGYLAVHALITHDQHASRPRIWVSARPTLGNVHGFAGLYRHGIDRLDVISLAAVSTPVGHGTIVHECTHAQIDMRRLQTPILTEEAAAYIAEAWYRLATGETNIPGSPPIIVQIARDVRERSALIREGTGDGLPPNPAELTQQELNQARTAMRAEGYTSGHYDSSGIAGCSHIRIQRGHMVVC